MHLLENLALLAADLHAHAGSELRELRAELVEGLLVLRRIDDHHHIEVSAGDGLADVEDVDVFFGKVGAGLCENANSILTDDGNDNLFHEAILYHNIACAVRFCPLSATLKGRRIRGACSPCC